MLLLSTLFTYFFLSSCADYVKHLVKKNKEKEDAIEKAKSDLEAKRRRVEEENAQQQEPSDPESTTSDLTESSSTTGKSSENKRATTAFANNSNKPLVSRDSTVSSSSSSSDNNEKTTPLGRSVAAGSVLSVSDVTDSNKGSSTAKSSLSSDAASGTSDGHADVVFRGDKKRKARPTKKAWVSPFVLDYEEVFVKSNVPQLLSTTSGRIATCRCSRQLTIVVVC